jgi:dihydrolipoamide dehydrogenase
MVVGEFAMDADVVIIGGGPAGYACAEAAARNGRKITIVDSTDPDKVDSVAARRTLLNALLAANMAAEFGITPGLSQLDLSVIRRHAKAFQDRAAAVRADLISTHDISVIQGTARFLSSREVQVAGEHVHRLRFKRAVICTGSRRSPHPSLDGVDGVISVGHLVTHPEDINRPVTVLGNSPVAIEAAYIASGLGAKTTLVCCGNQVLPGIPSELADLLVKAVPFDVIMGDFTEEHAASIIVDAADRVSMTAELGIETTSIKQVDGWIDTNDRMQTSESRILAAGDCTGPPLHAGAAAQQGRIAAETILGGHAAWDPTAIAHVCHTLPQVSWAGTQFGEQVQTLVLPWSSHGSSDGHTVLSWNIPTGTLTGIGAIGPGACDLADGFVTTLEMGTTIQDLADMVPAHVSGHCVLGDAARDLAASARDQFMRS